MEQSPSENSRTGPDTLLSPLVYRLLLPTTTTQAASVRSYAHTDGRHGIWLAGAVRSDLTPEGLRDMRANPPSGDWRSLNNSLELVAALSVVVPGFPIPRSQLALSASAGISALILPGVQDDDAVRATVAGVPAEKEDAVSGDPRIAVRVQHHPARRAHFSPGCSTTSTPSPGQVVEHSSFPPTRGPATGSA